MLDCTKPGGDTITVMFEGKLSKDSILWEPMVGAGQIKDMVNRGGEKIFSNEIEIFLLTYEAIEEGIVVGMLDKNMAKNFMSGSGFIKSEEDTGGRTNVPAPHW